MTLLAQEPYSSLLDDLGRCRIDDGSMIEYGRGPAAERRPLGELRRAVERDPRTFDCRDRDERESAFRKETSEATWAMARERARARHAPTFAWAWERGSVRVDSAATRST